MRQLLTTLSSRRLPGAALALAGVSLLFPGCVNPNVMRSPQPGAQGSQPGGSNLTVSASCLLAPGKPTADYELEDLEHASSSAALLRRAFLLLECRRPDAALDAAAQVLYGPAAPSANEEAFARFARAEAYAMLGHPERGEYDRDVARHLALDVELQRRLDVHPVAEPQPAGPVASTLQIQSRARWRPMAPRRSNLEPLGTPRRITIHHSALYFRDTRVATSIAQLQVIQRDHMQNRDYGDIGYHFLIDPAGRVWEGRELKYQGAHASGANNVQNIGVCLLGNFVRGSAGQGPTPQQVAAMRELVTTMMQRYHFGPEGLHVHNDFKATECPGPLLEPVVADLARDLRRGITRTAGATAAGY
ncbi:MAG: N-acetylmuramoyl-L-alanine amidase [Planctomycetes bacterium]|nr:N-acetylmuramoyl-L-alanine amidase [Planctomycetota bacterium]